MLEQLLAQRRRQVGLGIEEQRRDVVLQRTAAPALIVEEIRAAADQHHIARLEVAI
jgi:hypothetical protein